MSVADKVQETHNKTAFYIFTNKLEAASNKGLFWSVEQLKDSEDLWGPEEVLRRTWGGPEEDLSVCHLSWWWISLQTYSLFSSLCDSTWTQHQMFVTEEEIIKEPVCLITCLSLSSMLSGCFRPPGSLWLVDGDPAVCWLAVVGLGHAHQWGSEVTVGQELERLGLLQGLLPNNGEIRFIDLIDQNWYWGDRYLAISLIIDYWFVSPAG